MEFFAGYGFNKSHTVAYALVTYQTAYMKRHHPHAFMAALLTCECGDRDKLSEYIDECRRMGIKVLPPDVSRSAHDFSVEGDGDPLRARRRSRASARPRRTRSSPRA